MLSVICSVFGAAELGLYEIYRTMKAVDGVDFDTPTIWQGDERFPNQVLHKQIQRMTTALTKLAELTDLDESNETVSSEMTKSTIHSSKELQGKE